MENKFANTEVGVTRAGTKIVLPNDPKEMTIPEAIECLERVQTEEETKISVHETVDAWPLDGAYAFMKALKQIYGWASPMPKPGFFGSTPPQTVNLEIGYKEFTQVIWGNFKVPGIDGVLGTAASWENNKPQFVISGSIKKKHQRDIKKIADLTRHLVATESVYLHKAIRLKTMDDGNVNFETPPSFLDLSKVNEDELIFSDDLMQLVETNLFTPITKTEMCRKLKIPLKRGVLLEGPYGTGKTLTAFVTAKKCVDNGWTFIMIDRVAGLKSALTFARMYGPAVVFAEDVDRVVAGERTMKMDDVLNTIDGIESKGNEIITILTSNHADNISKAMLRPGRLDAVLSIQAPDASAAEKLMRLYGRNLIKPEENLTDAANEMAGQIPAVIREVVERSKLFAISRMQDNEEFFLTGSDLAYSAKGMKNHLSLLNPKVETKSNNELLGESLANAVKETVYGNGLFEKVQRIERSICD